MNSFTPKSVPVPTDEECRKRLMAVAGKLVGLDLYLSGINGLVEAIRDEVTIDPAYLREINNVAAQRVREILDIADPSLGCSTEIVR